MKITELGCTGHMIVGHLCRWKRHTQVGNKFRVSTVGNYYGATDKKRAPLGAGHDSFFETMVFPTTAAPAAESGGCGCHEVESWGGIDSDRYSNEADAQAGHEEMVAKYVAIAQEEAP